MDLTNYKNNEIKALANIRKSYDWNYIKNPEFNIKNQKRYDGGTISILINVQKNKIKEISFFGDFLSKNDFENIYKLFIDQEFSDKNIKFIINSLKNFNSYFGNLKRENIIELILGK
jgi:lipoate-protein ligase A